MPRIELDRDACLQDAWPDRHKSKCCAMCALPPWGLRDSTDAGDAGALQEEWPEDEEIKARIQTDFCDDPEIGDRRQEIVFIGQNLKVRQETVCPG